MQSPTDVAKPRSEVYVGVHALVKALGLRDYSHSGGSRVAFEFEPVARLYRLEISALFGTLCRDEGILLDRHDPSLFDEELDELLREFGPLIWPMPGEGDRGHLHKAQAGTAYDRDLWYPRDTAAIKEGLRRLILAKKLTAGTDIHALIGKRHKDANLRIFNSSRKSVKNTTTQRTSPEDSRPSRLSQDPQDAPSLGVPSTTDAEDGSDSEDSVMGATTRRRASTAASSSVHFSCVELRLYRKVNSSRPSELAVISYGSIFITPDCTTAHDIFDRVCHHISTDCSFMIFQLPEDMSAKSGMRLQRDSGDAQTKYQELLHIFRKAKKFPGEPGYRSVEVEVGLDMFLDA